MPDTAPPDAQLDHTGRVRCSPDSGAESSVNSQGHRTQATGRTLSVRCSPDSCAERAAKPPAHRTLSTGLSPVLPVHSAAPDSTSDAKGQRPVPPRRASGECFFPRLLQTSHRRNIKYILNFLKSAESPSHTKSVPTPPLKSVPTPPSVHHLCASVLAFSQTFSQRS